MSFDWFRKFFRRKETITLPLSLPPVTKVHPVDNHQWVSVMMSSFADPKDVVAYKKAKAKGWSDQEAFKVGDNGIGCWGDLTAQEHTPMCALPPETMAEWWGSKAKAKHQRVIVRTKSAEVVCILADSMPRRKNIKNGAGIDLNPAAAKALGLKPPFMVRGEIRPQ